MAPCRAEPATPSKKNFIVLQSLSIPLIAGTQNTRTTRGMTWTPSEKNSVVTLRLLWGRNPVPKGVATISSDLSLKGL